MLEWLHAAGVTELTLDSPAMPLAKALTRQAEPIPVAPQAVTTAQSTLPPAMAPKDTARAADLAAVTSLTDLQNWMTRFNDLSLCKTATQPVLGRWLEKGSNPSSPSLMVVAEAPDAVEDQNGEAFSGPAHDLLRQALRFLPVASDQIYLTYLSKWRPPGQRSLLPPELALAQALLQTEITLLAPRHFILLGDGVTRAIGQIAESMALLPASGDSTAAPVPVKSAGRSAASDKKYDLVFKGNNSKNRAISLQKPETMLKESLTKKRVWQSLLSFCQMLPATEEQSS